MVSKSRLLTLLFLSPSNATGIRALGWEEKNKKSRNKTEDRASLAKMTTHYESIILFSFKAYFSHGQVVLLLIQCIREVIAELPYHLSS